MGFAFLNEFIVYVYCLCLQLTGSVPKLIIRVYKWYILGVFSAFTLYLIRFLYKFNTQSDADGIR
jgi:hypothetical protein